MNEIILLLPSNFLNEINKREKNKAFGFLKKIENFRPELLKREEEEEEKKKYDIDIINESIFKMINQIFGLKYEETIILIGKGKIILKLILENNPKQYAILIYSLDKNFFLLYEFKIIFNEEQYLNEFINNFKSNGINSALNNLNFDKENKNIIYDNKKIIEIIYKNPNIKNSDNKKIGNKNNELNISKSEIKTNEINEEKEQKKIINLESTNLNEKKNKSYQSDNKNNEINNNKINENNKSIQKLKNKEEYLLLGETKKQILILINYNSFHKNLKQKLKNSKCNIQEELIYLVNAQWKIIFIDFYSYEDIIQNINIGQDIS